MIANPGEGDNLGTSDDAAMHSAEEHMPQLGDTQETPSNAVKQDVTIEEHSTIAAPDNGINDGPIDDTVMPNKEEVLPKNT